MRFNRSWLPAIVVVLVLLLLQQRVVRLPWPAQAVLAIGGGLWFLWTAWNIWRNPTGGAIEIICLTGNCRAPNRATQLPKEKPANHRAAAGLA